MRFAFIDAQKALYPLTLLCRVMQVRRSGFYAWAARSPSARQLRDQQLRLHIRTAFEDSRRTYGSPRILAQLRAQAVHTSKRRVQRLMQQQGLHARQPRRWRRTTDSRHRQPVAPNLVQRNFTAPAPNRLWSTDLTYVWTKQGWLYLAVLLDLYSRRVVGWAMSERLDEDLALRAPHMALARRKPSPGLIHHSDRGSQYCGRRYLALLQAHGVQRSMSRKGDCFDNSCSESFFGTLKQELIYQRSYATRAQAQSEIFEYLEVFYNRQRRHSKLGYLSPEEYEQTTLAVSGA